MIRGSVHAPSCAPSSQPVSQARPSTLHAYGGGRGRGGRGGRGGSDGLILGQPDLDNRLPEHMQQRNRSNSGRSIILPGGAGGMRPQPGAPARLIVPEDAGDAIGESINTPTPPNRYRPPAGFMDEALQPDETANLSPSEMLSRLRARAGKWHTLAKYLPSLYKQNYDSTAVDEATGITPLQQNKWVVAGTIHESMRLSGKVPPEVMAVFDAQGDSLLYPFRYVGVDMRVMVALYVAEKALGPTECEVLARAMKEWDRRPLERYGFSDHPGDCLAFKYLRDALEADTRKDLEMKVEQGLQVAVTDGARKRLKEVLMTPEELASSSASPMASMLLLRLNEDEIGYRTLPMLGTHDQIRVRDLKTAPKSSQDGFFGVFTLIGATAADVRWVALPQWKALTQAKHPVAIEVTDCAQVPAIIAGTKVKTDDDRKRLQGPGLVVLEAGTVTPQNLSPETYYLSAVSSTSSLLTSASGAAMDLEKVELVDGAKLKASGRSGLATMLFLCRPPVREGMQASAETSQLLSI